MAEYMALASKQDAEAQLSWLDETLKNAKEDWVIVSCHHPFSHFAPITDYAVNNLFVLWGNYVYNKG